jgi:excisionase family DNA binding protein
VGGVIDVDLALLHGPDRAATVQIAGWVRSTVLDDGTAAHGIVYRSRHAGGDVHARLLAASVRTTRTPGRGTPSPRRYRRVGGWEPHVGHAVGASILINWVASAESAGAAACRGRRPGTSPDVISVLPWFDWSSELLHAKGDVTAVLPVAPLFRGSASHFVVRRGYRGRDQASAVGLAERRCMDPDGPARPGTATTKGAWSPGFSGDTESFRLNHVRSATHPPCLAFAGAGRYAADDPRPGPRAVRAPPAAPWAAMRTNAQRPAQLIVIAWVGFSVKTIVVQYVSNRPIWPVPEPLDDEVGRMTIENPEPLLTPRQVAALFRVDTKTVARWASNGWIGSIRTPGGHRRFRESEVRELLAAATAPDASATA